MAKDEIVDIVNEKNEVIGTMPLSKARTEGHMYRLVQILIFNKKGEIYLHKRPEHVRYGGYITSSAGGHVGTGEDIEVAARRELKEEIYLEVELQYIDTSIIQYEGKNRIISSFVGFAEEVKELNKKEVESGKFYSYEELLKLLKQEEKATPVLIKTLKEHLLKNIEDLENRDILFPFETFFNEKYKVGTEDKVHALEVESIACELWEKQEKTKVPIALRIAARFHDIDRVFPKTEVNTKNCSPKEYTARKVVHSGMGVTVLMQKASFLNEELQRDVAALILRHELGGDKGSDGSLLEQKDEYSQSYNLHKAGNYLYYADKLSFFYSMIEEYSKRGREKLQNKIKFSTEGLPKEFIDIIKSKEYISKIVKEEIAKLQ